MSETERGKFITIHGIDGTGKSTATVGVVKKMVESGLPTINYDDYKETKDNPHKKRKQEMNEGDSLEDKLAVYLESMMYHSDEISSLLSQGYNVVKSRYLDDIEAHFSHLGISRQKLEELKAKFPMVQPDLKVILLLTEDKRRERLNKRGIINERDLEEKKTGTRLGFFEDYLMDATQKAPPGSVLHVNTGELDVEQVVQKIVNHVIDNR